MASAMVASPTQACQCSIGNWLVMMVALLAARSSMISKRSARVWLSSPVIPQSSNSSTSVRASWISHSKRPVAVAHAQFLAHARHPLVNGRVATPAGVLRQRTTQPGLSRPGGAGDQHAVPAVDPVAQRQAHHGAAIQPSAGAGVDVLDGRLGVFQVRLLQQPRLAFVVAPVHFAVHQQGQALLEAHRGHSSLGELFL